MTTLKLTSSLLFARAQPQPVVLTPRPPLGWLERLAAWAERQPRHRHLGSWTAV